MKLWPVMKKITLIPTGSYTNIALLFAQYPEVKDHIERIVAMGGTLGKGNMTSAAEFNVFTDPHAAKMMYHSGVPIVMVGLDITMKALLTHDSIETLPTLNETGKMLHDIIINDGDNSDKASPCTTLTPFSTCFIRKPSPLKRCGWTFKLKVRPWAKQSVISAVLTTMVRRTRQFVWTLMLTLLTSGLLKKSKQFKINHRKPSNWTAFF